MSFCIKISLKVSSISILFLSALSPKGIDLVSMLGVYIVLGVGTVIAFLTLIGEMLWKRRFVRTFFFFYKKSIGLMNKDNKICRAVKSTM